MSTNINPDLAPIEEVNAVPAVEEAAAEKVTEKAQPQPAEEPAAELAQETAELAAEPAEQPAEQSDVADYSGKSLSELSDLFHSFATSEDRLQRAKEAEALKSAFYKTLTREKEKLSEGAEEVFNSVEENFKALYASFKKEKAAYNRMLDAQKEENLKTKQAVIEDLKALLEKEEDISATVPAFREIQARWRAAGAVPTQNFRDINNTYQLYVEQFYDKLKINRELRDLDFKKNFEIKTTLCEKAEALAENENCIEAFRELQKLHETWKDLGPVAKQYREEIWERFKVATAAVNKKYQTYFEGKKGEQEANLEAKSGLCEKVEAIAAQEIADSKLWNALSKEIESIQAEWRKIGYATKKDNQKIYDRFRLACDQFYARKRDFYNSFKDDMEENLKKKIEICEIAEQLKNSTEWKKASDEFIDLQKKWKEIGAVPRKKSDALWKRFRAACDEFFAAKQKAKPENDFYSNLKAKRAVIEKILAYTPEADQQKDTAAYNAFLAEYNAIGFVPFKDKEKLAEEFKAAIAKAFPGANASKGRSVKPARVLSEKDQLVAKFKAMEQEIATKENNILFFGNAKGNALVDQMRQSIEQAKVELKELEEKIRSINE